MILVGGKRYCGKTTELINIADINQIPIIVLNKQRGKVLEDMAKREGKEVKIIAFEEKEKLIGTRTGEILIDDIEDILSWVFYGRNIVEATTSSPFKPLKKIERR